MSKLTGTSVPKILFFKGGKAAVSVSLRGLTSVRKAFSTAFFIRSLLPSGPTKKATAPLYTLAARARASVKEEILIVARECYDMRRFWILDGGAKTMVCPQRNGEEHNKRRRLVGKRETSFTNKNGAYILKDSRCPLFGQKYYRDQRLGCWGILGTRPKAGIAGVVPYKKEKPSIAPSISATNRRCRRQPTSRPHLCLSVTMPSDVRKIMMNARFRAEYC